VLIDTEHPPGDPLTVWPQLPVIAGYPGVAALVGPAANDAVLIKCLPDADARSLLIRYVNSAAKAAVHATRNPPHGIRGVSALTRATRFGRMPGYFDKAADAICVIVQIENLHRIKAAGLLTADADLQRQALAAGVDFLAIGMDAELLARSPEALLATLKNPPA
jgi:4-hydroxy-2-oxoheptanedioate aldolase